LKLVNLKPFDDCINHLVDDKGNDYFIPNYCINDPYFEKIIVPDDDGKQINDENCENICQKQNDPRIIKINLFDLYNNKKIQINVDDHTTGKELKDLYIKSSNVNTNKIIKFRLLFGGSEILDEHKLYQHKMCDDYTIQILLTNELS
jgi:hypothetical protein